MTRADRVMLCSESGYGLKTDPDSLETPLADIRGSDKVRDLVQALDLEAGRFDQTCNCLGSHRVVFMRGEHYLFELTYHHLSRLRGGYGIPYWGDLQLSDKGAAAVIQWFKTHGFDRLEEGKMQQEAEIARRATEHASLAALLPEKARTWLPPYDYNSKPWKWKKDAQVATLLGCFGSEQEGVLTLWRMLGMNSKAARFSGASRGEPASFLLHALNCAKPASLFAAADALPAAQGEARLGAFLHAAHCYDDREWKGDEAVMRRILTENLREGLDAQDEDQRYWMITGLASAKARPVPSLLASELERVLEQRARGYEGPTAAGSRQGRDHSLLIKLLAWALKVQDPALLPALQKARALPSLSDHERKICDLLERLASAASPVTPDDLLCEDVGFVNLPLLAWRAYRTRSSGEPTLRMLGAALKSPSYEVRDEAKALLREAGVEQEESSTERLRRDRGRRGEESSAEVRARLQEATKAAKSDKARRVAFDELGDFLLAQGAYEEALIAFRRGGAYGSLGATLAGIALGRPNEGSYLSHGLARSSEQANKFIAKGAATYAVGRFDEAAEAFLAASMMADWPECENCAAAAELIGRLAGQAPLSRGEEEPRGLRVIDEDQDAVAAFVRGAISREQFVERRKQLSDAAKDAFTWWVVAQMARIDKDRSGELEALNSGKALSAHASVWHILMVGRAREIALE